MLKRGGSCSTVPPLAHQLVGTNVSRDAENTAVHMKRQLSAPRGHVAGTGMVQVRNAHSPKTDRFLGVVLYRDVDLSHQDQTLL